MRALFGVPRFFALGLILQLEVKAADELSYGVIEQVRTKTDSRERMADFEINRSAQSVRYQRRETPTGSLEPIVKAVNYQRDINLSEAEVNSLFDRLVGAGIFKLPLSAEHRGNDSIWSLFGSLKGRKFELSYRRPPTSGVRKRIDDTVSAIIRELGLDLISGPSRATIIRENGTCRLEPADEEGGTRPAVVESEGDLVPPRQTTLERLISHPEEFHGKRVSLVGFYHSEFEGQELRADEKSDYEKNVWCSDISTFAPRGVEFCQDCWARVEGTFLKGPTGHFGLWPGELTRVTRFDVQPTPTIAEAHFSVNADRSLPTLCPTAPTP